MKWELSKDLNSPAQLKMALFTIVLIEETLLYCFTITKSLEHPTPFLPNLCVLIFLDFSVFYLDSQKSPLSGLFDGRRLTWLLRDLCTATMQPKTLLLLCSLSYSTLKLTSLPCGKSTFSQAESKTNVLELTSRERVTFPLHDVATDTTYYRRPNHCRLVSFTKYCQQRSIEAFCLRMLHGALLTRKTAGMHRAEKTMAIFARNQSWDNSGLFSF